MLRKNYFFRSKVGWEKTARREVGKLALDHNKTIKIILLAWNAGDSVMSHPCQKEMLISTTNKSLMRICLNTIYIIIINLIHKQFLFPSPIHVHH